ncbi:MAG: glycoside hydrolase family 3 protein, partial [Oscillospiraceae bacterium]|nr:glycoside hydrolase family 3 protein [Oscillospiraceae bacterium]
MKHEDIVSKLTLAEKCGLLSGKDMWSTRSAPELGIPSIILSDGPSGVRRQLGAGDQLGLNESEKATCFPSASTVANSWDEVIAQRVGEALGREASALGVDVLLGPGLNVKRSPLCGRNFEYFSEDPYLAGKMAAGYVRGIQSEQVSACPKHFAVNSQELHRMASDSVLDERTLREIYLANFEIAVREGLPKTIMTSYNAVNGTYANENAHLLTDILRGEWGFDGTVVTDWGGGNDFTEGVRAGCNLEMPGTADDSTCQLYQAVKSGGISEREVDQRVDELLNMVLWVSGRKKAIVDFDAQNEIAREAAEASIVLLKNEDNVLPLSKTANVAIMGDFASVPRYQGAGSSQVNAVKLSNTIDAANSIFKGKISFSRGFTRKDNLNEELANEAAAKAKSADVVLLYLGLPEVFESEGLERPHMRIPDNQIKLLEK